MHRRSDRKKRTHAAFNARARKTHRLNLAAPLRGGIRL